MIMVLIFIAIGIVMGLLLPVHIDSTYTQYAAVVILALMDSIFGAVNSKNKNRFDLKTFWSGFFGNSILAAFLTFIGNKLDVNLYLVALIVFGTRLFGNFSEIRRFYLSKM